jgi:hypothetical protein
MNKGNGAVDDSGAYTGKPAKSTKTTKGGPEPNPEAKEEWSIPTGKKFGDFFSPAKNDLKPNCVGWPSFPHHLPKTERPMCLRFQTTGECTANCGNSHILPSKMSPKVWSDVKARIKEILGN